MCASLVESKNQVVCRRVSDVFAESSKIGVFTRLARAAWWHGFDRWRRKFADAVARHREITKPYPLLQNVGGVPSSRKRALLCYNVDPFLSDFDATQFRSHCNRWRSTKIVELLGLCDYQVDATDWRNMHSPPGRDYDLVFGLGRAFTASCKKKEASTKTIYFGTGTAAEQTIAAEHAGIRELRKRRGQACRARPLWRDRGQRLADAIFVVGDRWTQNTYQPTDAPIYECPNSVVDGIADTTPHRRFEEARRNFLWMAAYGAIRRRLDIVLEAFSELPDYNLWICGGIEYERDFFQLYRRELTELPNVRYMGRVDVTSEQFAEITSRCGYILCPSRSDGMPGSVVNSMAAGVVPMVTEEAGMDTGGLGIGIPEIENDTIRELVIQAADADPIQLKRQAQQVCSFARARYSQQAFRDAFRRHLTEVLEYHGMAPGQTIAE